MTENRIFQTIRAVLLGGIAIAGMGSSLARAQDQFAPVPPAPQPLQQSAPMDYAEPGAECCDCARCRMCYPWKYLKHDMRFFCYYIRGNGPAIHSRPAAIYWW